MKEIGVEALQCPCLGGDLQKIFEIYWDMGAPNAKLPSKWRKDYETAYNSKNMMDLTPEGDQRSPGMLTVRSWLDYIIYLLF